MNPFNLFPMMNVALWVVVGIAALALLWTVAASAVLLRTAIGGKLPLWASLHPLALMYNPKSDEHVHAPSLTEVGIALVVSLFAAPILLFLGLVYARTLLLAPMHRRQARAKAASAANGVK